MDGMLVLDHGSLWNFSCGQRMGILFVGFVAAQALVLVSMSLRARYAYDRFRGTRYEIETLDDTPFFAGRRLKILVAWSVVVTMVSIGCMFLRTQTLLGMDPGFIIETSCIGPFASEYRLDRARTTIRHVTEVQRHSEDNFLDASEHGKYRDIFIELSGRENSKDLMALAPEAMQHYAAHLHAFQPGRYAVTSN
jgi:hypothetical protein